MRILRVYLSIYCRKHLQVRVPLIIFRSMQPMSLIHVLDLALYDVSLLLSPSLSESPHRREVSRSPLLMLVVPLMAFYPPRLVYLSKKLSISHLRKFNSTTKLQAFQPLARNYRLRATSSKKHSIAPLGNTNQQYTEFSTLKICT